MFSEVRTQCPSRLLPLDSAQGRTYLSEADSFGLYLDVHARAQLAVDLIVLPAVAQMVLVDAVPWMNREPSLRTY